MTGVQRTGNELLKRFFLIGDKSRYFYNDKLFRFTGNTRINIEIEDSNVNTLEHIFNFFSEAITSDKEYIADFFVKNKKLKTYFENVENKEHFIKGILSSAHFLSYRNYYLKILHQLYCRDYRNDTHFISTTTNKAIALQFASRNGIIIHCWQPIESKNIKSFLQFKKYQLPRLSQAPFIEQFEESIIAGILPHFISGIEILAENQLYINPNLLSNRITNNLFLEGISINQSQFSEYIVKTQFRRFFMIAGKK